MPRFSPFYAAIFATARRFRCAAIIADCRCCFRLFSPLRHYFASARWPRRHGAARHAMLIRCRRFRDYALLLFSPLPIFASATYAADMPSAADFFAAFCQRRHAAAAAER